MWSHGRIIHLPQFKPKPPANKRVCPLRLAVPVRAHVPPIHAHSTQTFSRVAGNMDMPEKSKLDFLKIVGEYHMRVLEGADTLVQLSGMLAKMCLLKHNVAPSA
jgi:hypothetical protein